MKGIEKIKEGKGKGGEKGKAKKEEGRSRETGRRREISKWHFH